MNSIADTNPNQSANPAVNVGGERWGYVAGGILLLLALGLVYAWSIFVAPLEAEFKWQRSETSLAFSICMSMFCIGGIATGLITKKWAPRVVIWITAVLVGVGFIGASKLTSLTHLYFFYGGLVGFGVGMAYNGVISTVLKWFPEKPGLISGLLMMGFGLGSLILGTVGSHLIQTVGWRNTFLYLGIVYVIVIFISSFFVKLPGKDKVLPKLQKKGADKAEVDRDWNASEMLKRPAFWIFFIWSVVLCACGLIVISNAAPMISQMGHASKSGLLVGLIAIFNGLGRVFFGLTYDKAGRQVAMPIVSLGFMTAGILLICSLSMQNVVLLVIGAIMSGFMYGGLPTSSSTVIRTFYGLRNYSLNFSLVNLNIVFASFLGPFMAGLLLDKTGSYQSTFIAIIIFGALSLGLNFLIKKP
jgi:OFA family oxalate/formate antiporter-like MFS transporter